LDYQFLLLLLDMPRSTQLTCEKLIINYEIQLKNITQLYNQVEQLLHYKRHLDDLNKNQHTKHHTLLLNKINKLEEEILTVSLQSFEPKPLKTHLNNISNKSIVFFNPSANDNSNKSIVSFVPPANDNSNKSNIFFDNRDKYVEVIIDIITYIHENMKEIQTLCKLPSIPSQEELMSFKADLNTFINTNAHKLINAVKVMLQTDVKKDYRWSSRYTHNTTYNSAEELKINELEERLVNIDIEIENFKIEKESWLNILNNPDNEQKRLLTCNPPLNKTIEEIKDIARSNIDNCIQRLAEREKWKTYTKQQLTSLYNTLSSSNNSMKKGGGPLPLRYFDPNAYQSSASAGSDVLGVSGLEVRPKIGGQRTKRTTKATRKASKRSRRTTKRTKGGFVPSIMESFVAGASNYIAPLAGVSAWKLLNNPNRK